ncbi:uncharacterized protein MONBRDRAFT_27994 [Monosiga brevicollis MX1]|uniref:Palmitoyltransferase n=1 Tax=Monosiga brevicollis TaxID=81824 RepID=A9V6W6_MONBE|nr:uncharacterized protein MONBRDRAFT_27994 [Monosiga brevicollis MX1]EDQ86616.1 predicted protein [Monosiga brevicollis MX1]|eukprot:XP_001748452.1 hypothetical protein [Monosiga brevicollis MX1]
MRLVDDTAGIVVAGLTHALLLYGLCAIRYNLLEPGCYHHYVVFTLYFMATVSHLRAMLTDPGRIGRRNHKFFMLFVLYTFALCLYSAAMMVRLVIICPPLRRNGHRLPIEEVLTTERELALCQPWSPLRILANTFLGVEAMLFGMFTAIMLVDQLVQLLTDATTIESMKKIESEHRHSGLHGLRRICGPLSPLWLVPCQPRLPASDYGDVAVLV